MLSFNYLFSKTLQSLKGRWLESICVLGAVNLILVILCFWPIPFLLLLLFAGPITIGMYAYSLRFVKNKTGNVESVFNGLKYNLGNGVLASIIIFTFILFFGLILSLILSTLNFLIFLEILEIFFSQSYAAFVNDKEFSALFTPFKSISISEYFSYSILFIIYLLLSFFVTIIMPFIIVSLPFSFTFFIMAEDTSIDAWDAIQKGWLIIRGHKRKFLMHNIILILIGIPFFILYVPFVYLYYANFYLGIKSEGNIFKDF